jgi:hypothetical protein
MKQSINRHVDAYLPKIQSFTASRFLPATAVTKHHATTKDKSISQPFALYSTQKQINKKSQAYAQGAGYYEPYKLPNLMASSRAVFFS